ncbi:MAG: hypothetical protein HXY34_09995 [Candidatus Thorarchaeota archaeon]|nr:hypothetical protein [Candidatus Thorarchaeota archaeon]
MIKGLMVFQSDGTPVYSYPDEMTSADSQTVVTGLVHAIQVFAKDMFDKKTGAISSATVSNTMFTFRTLTLRGEDGKPLEYCFVVMTEAGNREDEANEVLEYLMVTFLGYESGRFERILRQGVTSQESFKSFDSYAIKVMTSDWHAIRKKVIPVAASILQGVLNGLRGYLSVDQILAFSPKLQRIGSTYVWLSDRLDEHGEQELLSKIEQTLRRLYGPGVFESVLEQAKKDMLTE